VYKEAKTLVKAGYEVTIVCRMEKMDKSKNEQYEGFKIQRVLCPHPPLETSRIIRLNHNRKNSHNVAKKIIELKPDVIHCHDLNTLAEGVRARNKLKVPLVYDSHEDWPLLELAKSNSKIVYQITRLYEKRLLKKVTHRIVAASGQARLLTSGNSLLLMNCPSKKFMENADPDTIINKYDLKNKIVITYHGGVDQKKGIIEMIEVAKILTGKHKNIKFMVIGGGHEPFYDMVKKLAIEHFFIFTGRVEYSEIPSYLKASDICYAVQRPTRQYAIGTPTKILEGLAAGISILGNAEFPVLKDIVKQRKTGILVRCEVKDIVRGLSILIKDKNLRRKMGENGQKAMLEKYNWESQAKKLVDFYRSILDVNLN
jgi:glycosyltransferase involved in cell wall biosynthesis